MRIANTLFPLLALSLLSQSPASACMMAFPLEVEDVKYADLVVVGTIENYQIVLDQRARDQRKDMLANLPEDTDPEFRRLLEEQDGFLSDYAQFDLVVEQTLMGSAPARITVVWDNSTFGEPDRLTDSPVLVALVAAGSASPPLRGPSATILPHPDGRSLSVLQAPCAGAFIFPATSSQAVAVRALLRGN